MARSTLLSHYGQGQWGMKLFATKKDLDEREAKLKKMRKVKYQQ